MFSAAATGQAIEPSRRSPKKPDGYSRTTEAARPSSHRRKKRDARPVCKNRARRDAASGIGRQQRHRRSMVIEHKAASAKLRMSEARNAGMSAKPWKQGKT